MSHIEIQATRTTKQSEQPQGRERYTLPNAETNSATPFYIGSMIIALALYLKSIAVSKAVTNEAPRDEQDHSEQRLNPEVVGLAQEVSKKAAVEESPVEIEEEVARTGNFAKSSAALSSFTYVEERDFFPVQYVPPHRQGNITSGEPVAFPVMPSNDNHREVASNGNVTGGTGGTATKSEPVSDKDDDLSDDEDPNTANRRPQVSQPVVLYDQFACIAVLIALDDLLQGASDPDGDLLQVVNATVSSGELNLVDSGFQFVGELTGPVTVTYQVSDGSLFVLQTATFNVLDKPPIMGTADDDNLLGTMCCDSIFGLAGNDQIDARDGDDEIYGGVGDDHIVGGEGDDTIFGGEGNDIIFGGAGNDHITGEAGHDRLFGGSGDDVVDGNVGDDILYGDSGNDILLGGAGNDHIADGTGSDHVDGEAGDDVIVATADSANDLYSGGEGIDRLDYSESDVTLTFVVLDGTGTATETAPFGEQSVDQFANIEVLIGGQADDMFLVDETSFKLDGGAGNDIFEVVSPSHVDAEAIAAVSAVQHFNGGAGTDVLDYSHADGAVHIDVVSASATGATIATDTFEQIEHFIGSNNNDSFIIGEGTITLDGRSGDDMFEFLTSAVINDNSHSEHHIVGFDQGDWVRMSQYDIFEDAVETLEDAFEDIYGDNSGSSHNQNNADEVVPIRIRHEVSNDLQKTFIDADFNSDNYYEISVQLDGNHNLLIINNHLA